jgi:26S proteasome regulatory subunit N11
MERFHQLLEDSADQNIDTRSYDTSQVDTSEQVRISPLALLKMLKNARAGVPMEVMGLMLGEFVDDYMIYVVDVFAMPQSGTGVSVEAVDPVFESKMLDMLKQVGRREMVVGWYHSHPGFGCWLSGVDMNTQQSFEALNSRAVAVVIDPIQSVKGEVVIDAFRLINPQTIILGQEPRQTTSNLGHLKKPSMQALIHGLNRHYYSLVIDYHKSSIEQKILFYIRRKCRVMTYLNSSNVSNEDIFLLKKMTVEYAKALNEFQRDPVLRKSTAIPEKKLKNLVKRLISYKINETFSLALDKITF